MAFLDLFSPHSSCRNQIQKDWQQLSERGKEAFQSSSKTAAKAQIRRRNTMQQEDEKQMFS